MEKKMFNEKFNGLKAELKRLAGEGIDGGEICEQLDLTAAQAERLHYSLLVNKELTPDISLTFSTFKEFEVGDKGNIFVAAGRIKGLGLAEVFCSKSRLKATRQGDGILIESLGVSTESVTDQDELETVEEAAVAPAASPQLTPEPAPVSNTAAATVIEQKVN